MAAAAVTRLLAAVATLAAALSPGRGSDQVPVLAWSTQSSLWNPDDTPTVGRILSAEQLSTYLTPALERGPNTVLLFLQDKLSVEDFTVYGAAYGNTQENAFPNLQTALETSPSSLVLPAVDWRATRSLLSSLQTLTGRSPLYVHQLAIRELRLNASVPSLLVIRLPYTSSSIVMPAKQALSGNDHILGEVLQTLTAEGVPFLAILTAPRPSKITQDGPMVVMGPSRQLLASREEVEVTERGPYPPVAYNRTVNQTCILFWAGSIRISKGSHAVELTNRTFGPGATVDVSSSTCTNQTANLVLEYENIEELGSVRIVFRMSNQLYKVSAKWWFTVDQVEVYSDGDRASFNVTQISAPAIYSYHCQRVVHDTQSGSILPWTTSTQHWVVIFEDFQIQGFGVQGSRFSYASDCAGFFTPAIWMGLLTTFLMVFILTYGLHMITNLKTMDRFDDPKGPCISVPQTE